MKRMRQPKILVVPKRATCLTTPSRQRCPTVSGSVCSATNHYLAERVAAAVGVAYLPWATSWLPAGSQLVRLTEVRARALGPLRPPNLKRHARIYLPAQSLQRLR